MRLGRLGFDPLARPAPVTMTSLAQPQFITRPVDARKGPVGTKKKGKK